VVVVVTIYFFGNISAWRFMNVCFGVAFGVCLGAGILLEVVFITNERRCAADGFCPYGGRFPEIIKEIVPIVALVSLNFIAVIWLNVAAFAFPRPSSPKPIERFCAPCSPTSRAACYFFSFSALIGLTFFAWFAPIAIGNKKPHDSYDPLPFIGIIGGCSFFGLALLPVIVFLSSRCCQCTCIEKCFGDSDNYYYDPIPGDYYY
jgi:hypothetical protein